ncbi:MAG: hypothetical protein ACOY35_05340 [Bacillota bacterium]|nr:hypothetical protein [Bacillota bacterium]
MEQTIQQITTIAVVSATFVLWMWLACKVMKAIPAVTLKLGWGETPGLIVAVIALWPLFALTYQLFRFILPS